MVVAKQFNCAVCLYIVQEPVMQTACGHVYCQSCIAPCQICPMCREPLQRDSVKLLSDVNKMGMRLMHDIAVRCPYTSEGSH